MNIYQFWLKIKPAIIRRLPFKTLSGKGERIFIDAQGNLDYSRLDKYQKNHLKRYEFACNYIDSTHMVGDFACGTGYGSFLMSNKAEQVVGLDIDEFTVSKIKEKYKNQKNLDFVCKDLLNIETRSMYDRIISFETIEHLDESDILKALDVFNRAMRQGALLIFSTPYMQEDSEQARKMGFHKTFYINEDKIKSWLEKKGFSPQSWHYQNYQTHDVQSELDHKDFILVVAKKL